jgi:hypothetical protein
MHEIFFQATLPLSIDGSGESRSGEFEQDNVGLWELRQLGLHFQYLGCMKLHMAKKSNGKNPFDPGGAAVLSGVRLIPVLSGVRLLPCNCVKFL